MRRNEALGLRFNDIEWFGNEVNVRHAISKRRDTDGAHKWEWHVGPPKSRKSLRRIAATAGRGKEANARYEKSMADARVRHKAEARVSNPTG